MAEVTEAELQSVVVGLAHATRWRIHHCRAAMQRTGQWSTPIQGHAGFPDLVLLRGQRLLFVELKSTKGTVSDKQAEWRRALLALDGAVEYHEWRPVDWLDRTIERLLV